MIKLKQWMSNALAAALVLGVVGAAQARDERVRFPVEQAMTAPEAQQKLTGDIRFFWGDQAYPEPLKKMSIYTFSRKTNASNKSDQDACNWAWLSAMLELQEMARREGGNAVVNIRSVYKGGNFSSDSLYECGAGTIMAGVALEGAIVKLPD